MVSKCSKEKPSFLESNKIASQRIIFLLYEHLSISLITSVKLKWNAHHLQEHKPDTHEEHVKWQWGQWWSCLRLCNFILHKRAEFFSLVSTVFLQKNLPSSLRWVYICQNHRATYTAYVKTWWMRILFFQLKKYVYDFFESLLPIHIFYYNVLIFIKYWRCARFYNSYQK